MCNCILMHCANPDCLKKFVELNSIYKVYCTVLTLLTVTICVILLDPLAKQKNCSCPFLSSLQVGAKHITILIPICCGALVQNILRSTEIEGTLYLHNLQTTITQTKTRNSWKRNMTMLKLDTYLICAGPIESKTTSLQDHGFLVTGNHGSPVPIFNSSIPKGVITENW